jgi:hypothetical protein
VGAVEFQASAIRDEDYLYATFDSNLKLAGIFPIKMRLQNGGSEPIDLRPVRFLLSPAGQRPIDPRRAFKRLMTYYKIRAYNPQGYKASLADFVSYGFDQRAPLPPGESRWGILFFEDQSARQQPAGSVLSMKGIGTAELRLSLD